MIPTFRPISLRALVAAPYAVAFRCRPLQQGAGLKNPYLDEDIVPPALSERDIDDLVASLASLTSPAYKKAAAIELARRRDLSRTTRSQPGRRARSVRSPRAVSLRPTPV
jgi:hypothetical protein